MWDNLFSFTGDCCKGFYCGHKMVVYVLFYFVKEIRPQRIIADNLSDYVLGTRGVIITGGHSFLYYLFLFLGDSANL